MYLLQSHGFTSGDVVEIHTHYCQGNHAVITSMYQSPQTNIVYAYVEVVDHSHRRGQTLRVVIPDEVRKIEE